MDLRTVKDIVYGGKHLKNIKDSNNRIIWGGVEYKDVPYSSTLTVGSGQNITTTQYANRIVVPSLNNIKNKLATNHSVSSSKITITDVRIVCNTLYWWRGSNAPGGTTQYAKLSSTNSTSGTIVSVSNSTTDASTIYPWNGGYANVFSYMSTSSTKALYGYYGTSSTTLGTAFGTSITSTSGCHFCTSSSKTTVPTYSILVDYTINELVDAYPYRKLDGIKFSGNEYVHLSSGFFVNRSTYEITFEKNGTGSQAFVGDNYNRFDIHYNGVYLYCDNKPLYINLVDNGKYKVTLTTGSSNTSTPISGSVYDYQSGTTHSFSTTLSNTASLGFTNYIGCRYNLDYYLNGKLCEFNYTTTASVDIKTRTLVPCQRKSDSVCGLYDTTNEEFFPMSGTVITDGARGNVVDEYWDLT